MATPTLRVGMKHPLVVEVRQLLGRAGIVANYSVADPTVFDAGLKTLVEAFQRRERLAVDGVVGPATWAKLDPARAASTPALPTPAPRSTPAETPAASPAPAPGPSDGPPLWLLGAGAAAIVGGLWLYSRSKKGGAGGPMQQLAGLLGFGAPREWEVEGETIRREIRARRTSADVSGSAARQAARTEAKLRAETENYVSPDLPEGASSATRARLAREAQRERDQIFERLQRTGKGPAPVSTSTRMVGGKQAYTSLSVDAARFENDKVYRERMKDEAKSLAVDRNAAVRIVTTRGSQASGKPFVLWSYDPTSASRKPRFRDVTTDALIDEPAVLAEEGRCDEATTKLFKRSGLARTEREAGILRRVVRVVAQRCQPEFEEAAESAPTIAASIIGKTGTERLLPERTIRRVLKADTSDSPVRAQRDLSPVALIEREARKRKSAEHEAHIFQLLSMLRPSTLPRPEGRPLDAKYIYETPEGPYYLRRETEMRKTPKGPKPRERFRKVRAENAPSNIARIRRFDPAQLEMGTKVEMEHTSDPAVARRIAKDHLREDPAYYTKLLKAGL